MNISIEELGRIITDFVRVGYNCAVADYDPSQDWLRLSEVKKWLRHRHIELKVFKDLEEKGLICAHRTGTAINSPLVYSKTEIQKALSTMRVNRIFVNNKIKDYERINGNSE